MPQAIAAFTVAEDDYAEFLALSEDRSNLPDTYAEFIANLDRRIRQIDV